MRLVRQGVGLDCAVLIHPALDEFFDVTICLCEDLSFMACELEVPSCFGVERHADLTYIACISVFDHLKSSEVRNTIYVLLQNDHVVGFLSYFGAAKDAACVQLSIVIDLKN